MDKYLRFTCLVLLICFQIGGQILADETMVLVNMDDEYKYQNNGMQINKKNNEAFKIDPSIIISSLQRRLGEIPDLHRRSRFQTEKLEEESTKRFENSPATEISQTTDRTKTLMLVLPFNSDATDSIQELYNRPPVTKVIANVGVSKKSKPLKQVNILRAKVEKNLGGENMAPTTYKPLFYPKGLKKTITITTYRPIISPVDNKLIELNSRNNFVNKIEKYSSHYNAEKSSIVGSKIKPFKEENNTNLANTNLAGDVVDGVKASFEDNNRPNIPEKIFSKPILSSTIKQHQIRIEKRKPLVSISLKPKGYNGFNYISPNIKANDFNNFKPLVIRDNGNVEPGIQKYLHRYRLLEEKPISLNKYPANEKRFNLTVPSIIKITKRIDSDIDDSDIDDSDSDNSETQSDTINSLSNLDNYKQLKKLLQNIQELQNLNISLHENLLKEKDQNNLTSSTVDESGPDPINPEDNPDIDLKRKNEIKRQSNKPESTKISLDSDIDSDKESNTESIPEDESTTEALKDDSAEKLSNLEDSFGSLDNLDPITEEPLPPPRKNGFYFLADVNKFLEVGQDEDKVVVRFSQKIGDPSRFIPVKIPK